MTLPVSSTVARYYADVPNRIVGFFVDMVFLTVLSFVGAVIISVLFGPVVKIDLSSDPHITVSQGLAISNGVLSTVISAVYFVGAWRRLLGSPGQRLLRMQIATQANGLPITYRQGAVRWLLIGLPLCVEASLTPLISGAVDALLILVLLAWYVFLLIGTARSPMKQGLHDRLAHTIVTKEARSVASAENPEPEQGAVVR
jgi:hypothetical protein